MSTIIGAHISSSTPTAAMAEGSKSSATVEQTLWLPPSPASCCTPPSFERWKSRSRLLENVRQLIYNSGEVLIPAISANSHEVHLLRNLTSLLCIGIRRIGIFAELLHLAGRKRPNLNCCGTSPKRQNRMALCRREHLCELRPTYRIEFVGTELTDVEFNRFETMTIIGVAIIRQAPGLRNTPRTELGRHMNPLSAC